MHNTGFIDYSKLIVNIQRLLLVEPYLSSMPTAQPLGESGNVLTRSSTGREASQMTPALLLT